MHDAKYTFTLVGISGHGRDNDAALFEKSQFGLAFAQNKGPLPNPTARGQFTLSCVVVGNDIFPLKS